ncbi:MAG: ABC transporter substrate-binding protein [Rhizomicrobium sp.]
MARLPVSFACAVYDRMLPLCLGEAAPQGIDLNFIPIASPRETFDRMAGHQEFDAAEFSSSEFISRRGANDCPFVAIPVFPSRMFRHSFITVNTKTVKAPKDLEGKRIGVPLYTMSAAVWIRGLLQNDYGVDFSKVHWVQGATNKGGAHGNPTVLPLLKPVSIEVNNTGKSLSELLEAGAIDAIIGSDIPEALGRNPVVARLFPDFPKVEADYYKRTGIYPIMHLVAIRRSLYEQHPFIATSLYKAFNRSKDIALQRMRHAGMLQTMMPWMLAQIEEMDKVFGPDPWPYGVDANRKTLDALMSYLVQQSLIAKPIPIDDLFVPVFAK